MFKKFNGPPRGAHGNKRDELPRVGDKVTHVMDHTAEGIITRVHEPYITVKEPGMAPHLWLLSEAVMESKKELPTMPGFEDVQEEFN